MARLIEPRHHVSLDDYETVAHLGPTVRELRQEASGLVPILRGRRVWMVNSAPQGGGVAELLPPLIAMLRELGVEAHWLVMETEEPAFFQFTKRLHNLVHGMGDPEIGSDEQELYERVNRRTAESIEPHLSPGDILVIHDPQPMAAGALLREKLDIAAIWRCHIGLDREPPQTRAAWSFLGRYAPPYDHAVFTAPEYIPACFAGRATIIHPSIDPLSHKNRDLPIHKLIGVLANGSLIVPTGPVLTPPFPEPARRLQKDGWWAPASKPSDMGLLFRPIITQISRWDRLKGFLPLMEGFVLLKRMLEDGRDLEERYRQSLEIVRLVLAGPDPGSVQDDPEALEVLEEIRQTYLSLPPGLQDDIAILSLPMISIKYNALLVNALHRCSDIVVQNSLQEGFGLTATEAMWKRAAMVGTRAAGLRQQIRHGINGHLLNDAEDRAEVAEVLGMLLADQPCRERYGSRAQRSVHDSFLVFTHLRRWLELIVDTVERLGPVERRGRAERRETKDRRSPVEGDET